MSDLANKTKEGPPASGASNLAQRRPARAELVWEGKYDAAGRRVAPLRVALPFQTIETVNESAQDRQRSLQFGPGFREKEWRNRLIWGDKKYVLPSLLSEFAGKVNLIYIDPPFDTGADFSFRATVPDDPDTPGDDSFTFTKEPSIIEHKAFRDIWGGAQTRLDAYSKWFYETAVLLHELLHETGSLYVHLDWHVGHYAKVLLDEVFGSENFRNEIVWKRTSGHSDAARYGNTHDVIFFYSKSSDPVWNDPHQAYDPDYVEQYYRYSDPDGRKWMSGDLGAAGLQGGGYDYAWKGVRRIWRVPRSTMEKLDREGRIYYTKPAGIPRIKRYLDETKGMPAQDIWSDIESLRSWHKERLGYETQKPEALLDRIIRASSNEGDLILDSFCGSGTTAAVAEKLGRRWIACDLGRFAIHTARKRLLSISDVRPFIVQNLGKYERQAWAGAEFGDGNGVQAAARQRAYIEFILQLANATPLHGYTWLHGVKAGRMVHVGAVDAPISVGDVTQIAAEFKRAVGTGKDAPKINGVDVLGWDFAFELNEIAKQQAAAANIQMRFLRIPRDVMDKRAGRAGRHSLLRTGRAIGRDQDEQTQCLSKAKGLDDVPEEVRRSVKHWSQWIDYWAVDWNNKGDTFHNEWQAYRTSKDNSLQLEITNAYGEAGEYTIVVKVIDILGNDTTKTLKVRVV
jgi:adenine-specific DNA-methyltransferase